MGLLDQVHIGKQKKPRRAMLYGVHGVGKSFWAAQAPGAIFIPTEDGLADIDCASFPLAKTYGEVVQAISELYAESHEYRTVVIDSLDWLEQLIWAEVCERNVVKNIEKIGYAKGYNYAVDLWREVLDGLSALRDHRGMMSILLAHASVKKFQDPQTDAYDRYVPKLHEKAASVVQEWCDEVFFANYRTFVKTTEDSYGKSTVKGVGNGDRVVKTTERPSYMAKNRLNLPDELPLDWTAYAQAFGEI